MFNMQSNMASNNKKILREVNVDVLNDCLNEILPKFNVEALTENQFNALYNFMQGRDVFVNIPTGSGKSLIFHVAPLVEMWMFSHVPDSTSWLKDAIIIVITPLVALMKDQVNRLNNIGLKAVYVGCAESVNRDPEGIDNGESTYVFMSPESSLSNERWRFILENKVYQERLIGIVVDEANCIVDWGTSSSNKKNTAFRIWYSRLNELKSLVGKNVKFLALTATATKKTKRQIFEMLELDNPFEIVADPNRPNITFVVQKMDNSIKLADHFLFLIDELKQKGRETTRTIIYCQTIKQCAILFNIFKTKLGDKLFCDSTSNPRMRLCDMMHSTSPDSVKNHILEQFSDGDGHLRVLFATIAYGMGVNCKNVRRVIHFGPSKSIVIHARERSVWKG